MATMNSCVLYTLNLTEYERRYLRGVLRNYLGNYLNGDPATEPEDEARIREELFRALTIPGEPI